MSKKFTFFPYPHYFYLNHLSRFNSKYCNMNTSEELCKSYWELFANKNDAMPQESLGDELYGK